MMFGLIRAISNTFDSFYRKCHTIITSQFSTPLFPCIYCCCNDKTHSSPRRFIQCCHCLKRLCHNPCQKMCSSCRHRSSTRSSKDHRLYTVLFCFYFSITFLLNILSFILNVVVAVIHSGSSQSCPTVIWFYIGLGISLVHIMALWYRTTRDQDTEKISFDSKKSYCYTRCIFHDPGNVLYILIILGYVIWVVFGVVSIAPHIHENCHVVNAFVQAQIILGVTFIVMVLIIFICCLHRDYNIYVNTALDDSSQRKIMNSVESECPDVILSDENKGKDIFIDEETGQQQKQPLCVKNVSTKSLYNAVHEDEGAIVLLRKERSTSWVSDMPFLLWDSFMMLTFGNLDHQCYDDCSGDITHVRRSKRERE